LRLASRVGLRQAEGSDELNKGVAAYRDGKYDQAIEFFKEAKENRSLR